MRLSQSAVAPLSTMLKHELVLVRCDDGSTNVSYLYAVKPRHLGKWDAVTEFHEIA
jgi:hypothetical protein